MRPYDAREVALLADPNLTAAEIAYATGRTVHAVESARSRRGFNVEVRLEVVTGRLKWSPLLDWALLEGRRRRMTFPQIAGQLRMEVRSCQSRHQALERGGWAKWKRGKGTDGKIRV